jgi:hypothetical protein
VPKIPFNNERRENMPSPLWRFGSPPGMNEYRRRIFSLCEATSALNFASAQIRQTRAARGRDSPRKRES